MSEREHQANNLFIAGMVASMTCWGISWTSGKILSGYGDPLTISFLRFAVTSASLLAILLFMKEKLTIAQEGFTDLVVASLLISVYTFLFFKGLTVGKAGAGGVLVTVLNPIIAYAIMLVLARRKPTRNESIGLVLGLFAGVVLLRLHSGYKDLLNAGNLFFLVAAFSWAVLSRFTARATRYGSSITFSFWLYTLSTVFMAIITGWIPAWKVMESGDVLFWGNMFFSATITTSLATTFYFMATARIGASKASSFIFMVPFSAAIGSWIFLNEAIELHTIIGGVLGIAAVYILNKR
jgi:drug/metabolite transporter (DMT)-like permease